MDIKRQIGVFLFIMGFQLHVIANVYNVNSENDSGNDTLREAIIDANNHIGHDTIVVANTVQTITLSTVGQQAGSIFNFIRDTLTLFGNDVVLDAQVSARFMTLVENTIIIDVSFQNASSLNAGAVYNSGDSSSLINCTFINNTVLPNGSFSLGGAMYHANGHLTLNNCEFVNNNASSGGGAIHTRQGILDIYNCTFTNNVSLIKGQSINQNFGGIGSPSSINIYSCVINSLSSEPDIYFNDGNVTFHDGYSLVGGNKLWVQN